MRQGITAAVTALTMLLSGSALAADITLGSWNVKRLGKQHSYEALSAVAGKFDIIALQEVMSEDGLDRLESAIETRTGETWGRLESHLIGSRSYKEMYAFLYRESKVAYEDGAVVYMDRGDKFIREPYSARFRELSDDSIFALATVHILYGKGVEDRTPEIKALADYWTWLGEIYPGTELIMVGDFNLAPSHPAWGPLKQYARPLITSGASTLSGKDTKFVNLYDNIWVSNSSAYARNKAGILNYPKMIGWNHEKSRKHVSDHAPVYLEMGKAAVSMSGPQPTSILPAISSVSLFAKASPQQQKALAASGGVRGNSSSKIYHRPDCPSYGRISAKNIIEFSSASEATAAGYRLAGNCRGI